MKFSISNHTKLFPYDSTTTDNAAFQYVLLNCVYIKRKCKMALHQPSGISIFNSSQLQNVI